MTTKQEKRTIDLYKKKLTYLYINSSIGIISANTTAKIRKLKKNLK